MNAVRQIRAFNAGRDPQRLALKYKAMRSSAFAFLRGSCHLFYDRLPRDARFESAPLAWVCGDLHLENFGSYKADNRLVYFDLNDFDEAALAPAPWDVLRLLTSIHVGADSLAIDAKQAAQLCAAFVAAYSAALALGKAYWVERDTAQGPIGDLLNDLRKRQRGAFLDSRTQLKNKQRVLLTDGRKALPASKKQSVAVTTFMAAFARTQADPDFFKVLDVANRIAGTGSLGVERYVILVQGKGSPDGNYLLDLKRALPSSLLPHLKVPQPRWPSEAHRVVALQRRSQAVSMAFLQPVMMGAAGEAKGFVLRGLQPSEDRVTLNHDKQDWQQLEQVIATMGRLVAWSHLRSAGREGSAIADEWMAFGRRKKWQAAVLNAAHDCAARVRKDAAAFNAAYDDKAFDNAESNGTP